MGTCSELRGEAQGVLRKPNKSIFLAPPGVYSRLRPLFRPLPLHDVRRRRHGRARLNPEVAIACSLAGACTDHGGSGSPPPQYSEASGRGGHLEVNVCLQKMTWLDVASGVTLM